jgi:ribonuclease-3
MNKLNHLEEKLNIKFKDKALLKRALFHRSYLNEVENQNLRSNERLEFLGDAVLELWTTKQLFDNYPNLPEGILTNIRAAVVCTTCLAEIAEKMNLGDYLYLSKGEEKSGGRKNPSLLADTLEALIGAIYLDQGPRKTKEFLQKIFSQKIKKLAQKGNVKDAKTLLQELIQQKLRITPRYKIIEEHGPDHDKIFTSAVFYNNIKIAEGAGKSKRLAEETAAEKALTLEKKKGTI